MSPIPDPFEDRMQVEECALCILGAGIAGLNALAVASGYLGPDDRVILVDNRTRAGGMWTETYDYVRLHQPYERFTAGDINWTLGRDPSYLATKNEVLGHFAHCLDVLRAKVKLSEFYGYTYTEHSEVPTEDGFEAQVLCTPSAAGEQPLLIRAEKCVKAFGFRVEKNDALPFSSTQVRSISPHGNELLGEEMAASGKPVYIVGGGKTAMDTAHTLITRYPVKKVHLIVGAGTVFTNRNDFFPKGLRRWWRGHTGIHRTIDLALRFDGDNEDEVMDYFRSRYGLALGDDYTQFVFGLLSEEEHETIANGIESVSKEYVSDIVDAEGQATLVFRSGDTHPVETGSWVVNCTGHLMRQHHPYEPYLSEHGTVVSIQPTSGIHFLSTFSAYFLVHLLFLGKIGELPLYELNYQNLVRENKRAYPFASITQALYNLMLILGAVPGSVIRDCGLDFDRWFPMPRKVGDIIKLKRQGPRYAARCQQALDRVREKYQIECGVLARSRSCVSAAAPRQ